MSCKHSSPIDPKWLKYGAKLEDAIHCKAFIYPTVSVIPKDKPCWFTPSRWEAK